MPIKNDHDPDIKTDQLHTKPWRVLVTGGGGFLGSAIIKSLLAGGHRVTSFSRQSHAHLTEWGVEQFQGDISDAAAVMHAVQDVDVAFHVAAKAGVWGKYDDFFAANVIGTRNVIAAGSTAGVKALIYTSSPSVIFDGTDMEGVNESAPYPRKYHAAYPETKALAERQILKAAAEGLPAVILRPHLIWGPEDPHFLPRIIERASQLRRVGEGTKCVDTIYIDNAADAHILAATKLMARPGLSGRIYFISQDDPLPLWDMIDHLLQAAGREPVKGSVSPQVAWLAGTLLEWVYRFFKLKGEPRMTRFVARELATAHWFDISAARKDLDYHPRVSTAEGLRRLSEWLRADK
jgi:nucleoside-diphosphate-sugar epimerase